MNKLKSRKLLVTLAYAALVALAKAFEVDVSDEVLMTVAGVAAAYLLSQGWVDGKAADNKPTGPDSVTSTATVDAPANEETMQMRSRK